MENSSPKISTRYFFIYKTKQLLASVLIYFCCSSGFIFGQGIFEALSDPEIKKVTIETDINYIMENRRDTTKHDGVLSYIDASDNEVKWDIGLTIRGRYRRMFSKNIPPLKIDFKKSQLKEKGLEKKYDDFKLVTYFHEDKKEGLQTLIREYLIYKMYNVITPYSYRVQLLEIEYKDKDSGDKYKEYCFIIEDDSQIEDRLDIKELPDNIKNLELSMNDEQTTLVAMFEYFIGNGDWKIFHPKNLKLFKKDGKVIPIPYDFDFSGMVNAAYAVPNNLYGRSTVMDRVYLGDKVELAEVSEIVEMFKVNKDAFFEIIDNSEKLSGKNKKEMKSYIDSFFEDIEYRTEKGHNMKPMLKTLLEEEEKEKQK